MFDTNHSQKSIIIISIYMCILLWFPLVLFITLKRRVSVLQTYIISMIINTNHNVPESGLGLFRAEAKASSHVQSWDVSADTIINDRFFIALFYALEQTHRPHVACDSELSK